MFKTKLLFSVAAALTASASLMLAAGPAAARDVTVVASVEDEVPVARVSFADLDLARQIVASLKNQGIRLALDDFGTGHSSLSRLHDLPLAEIIRLVNKFSNNVMARHLLLTLGAEKFGTPATVDRGRNAVRAWLADRDINPADFVLDNGSGLSRNERVTARGLGEIGHGVPRRLEQVHDQVDRRIEEALGALLAGRVAVGGEQVVGPYERNPVTASWPTPQLGRQTGAEPGR